MARPARLERATLGSASRCSIHLSYGRSISDLVLRNLSEPVFRTPDSGRRSLACIAPPVATTVRGFAQKPSCPKQMPAMSRPRGRMRGKRGRWRRPKLRKTGSTPVDPAKFDSALHADARVNRNRESGFGGTGGAAIHEDQHASSNSGSPSRLFSAVRPVESLSPRRQGGQPLPNRSSFGRRWSLPSFLRTLDFFRSPPHF